MKKIIKKLSVLSLCMCMMVGMAVSASAQTDRVYSDNIVLSNSVGELDPSCKSRAKDYEAYCHKQWILDQNNIQKGAEGWTNIIEKKDGTYRFHYSNIFVYASNNPSGLEFSSGRKWGSGVVAVEVRAPGPFIENRIFYGW